MREPGPALIAAVAVAAAVGCGDNAPARPDAAPCPAECRPYSCDRRGVCLSYCSTAAQCAPDHVCSDGTCTGTECTAATAPAVCGAYACVDGDCVDDCALGPCADGFYCRGDTGACVPRCIRRGDPVCGGYVCDVASGECEPYCLAPELECAAGYVCDANRQCQVDATAPPCTAGCGNYACLVPLGRCATRCVDDAECAPGATCVGGACG